MTLGGMLAGRPTMTKKSAPTRQRPAATPAASGGGLATLHHVRVSDVKPAGSHTPRRLQRAAEIVQAARQAFLDNGFQGTSVAQIAAKVGVVEGLVYSYYPTKRDLLNEVLQAMYVPLLRDMEDGFARVQGLRSRLRFLIWRHLRVYVEEPKLSRLVLHEVRVSPEYFQSMLHDLHVRYTGFLVRALKESMAAGELSPATDVELVRSMVYGGIEHRMWSVLFGRGSIDVEAVADRFTDMVMRALDGPSATDSVAEDSIQQRLAQLERIVAGMGAPRR